MDRVGAWTIISLVLHRLGFTRFSTSTAMASTENNGKTSTSENQASSAAPKSIMFSSATKKLRKEFGYYFNEGTLFFFYKKLPEL